MWQLEKLTEPRQGVWGDGKRLPAKHRQESKAM